jgi:Transport protein particle (TRAPP) complex subunit
MVVYELFIINAPGKCLYYEDYIGNNTLEKINNEKSEQDRLKNIHGIAQAIKHFAKGLSPSPINNFKSFSTTKYKYNIFESASSLRFVLLTSVDETDYTELLRYIYSNLYLEYVVRNPLYEKDSVITSTIFKEKLREAMKSYL